MAAWTYRLTLVSGKSLEVHGLSDGDSVWEFSRGSDDDEIERSLSPPMSREAVICRVVESGFAPTKHWCREVNAFQHHGMEIEVWFDQIEVILDTRVIAIGDISRITSLALGLDCKVLLGENANIHSPECDTLLQSIRSSAALWWARKFGQGNL